MFNMKTVMATAAIGAVSLVALNSAAFAGGTSAGPVTEAGETIGLALGAALPQGVYFIDTASVVHNPGTSANGTKSATLDVLVNIPVVAWSTPWDVLGGHVEAYAALPEAAVDSTNLGASKPFGGSAGLYNPALLIGEAWNLGNDFHFSNFIGGYAPVHQPGFALANATNDVWTFNERAALTYLGNGLNLTAHAIYGHSTATTNSYETNAAGVSCAVSSCQRADYLNIDFTALKSFGKWDLGPVGYYTTDLTRTSDSAMGNKQIALGGFAGYNFGPVSAQAYVTHDVLASEGHLLGGQDTRFFGRLVIPLWNPEAPVAAAK